MVISFSKISSYRINFILTILGPAFIFFFIKYNLWSSIYEDYPGGKINGYDLQQMISYHVWALIISLVAQGHSALDLAVEIRHGKISTYLIYPFNFWEFHTASFLAFEGVQIGIALMTLGILSYCKLLTFPQSEFYFLACVTVSWSAYFGFPYSFLQESSVFGWKRPGYCEFCSKLLPPSFRDQSFPSISSHLG